MLVIIVIWSPHGYDGMSAIPPGAMSYISINTLQISSRGPPGGALVEAGGFADSHLIPEDVNP